MLKFDSWPPEPGKVQWTDLAQETLRYRHRVFPDVAYGEGFALEGSALAATAQFTGQLIISNSVDNSPETAFEIADGLTEGWTDNSKDMFMYQFGYGAGLTREQIDTYLSNN